MERIEFFRKINSDKSSERRKAMVYVYSLHDSFKNDVLFYLRNTKYAPHVDEVIDKAIDNVFFRFEQINQEQVGDGNIKAYIRTSCRNLAYNVKKYGLRELSRLPVTHIIPKLSSIDKRILLRCLHETIGFECTLILWLKSFYSYKKVAKLWESNPSSLRSRRYNCIQRLKRLKAKNKKLMQLLHHLNINW